MKRFLFFFILLCLAVAIGGYIFYKSYLPGIIAKAIVNDATPTYIPTRIMNKVDELRAPFNKGADEMIAEMKRNNIELNDVLVLVDNANEKEAYNFLTELNQENPQTTNQVFDIAKKHLKADFDVEIFREAFVSNVDM